MAFTIIPNTNLIKEVYKGYIPLPEEQLFYQDTNTDEVFKRKPFLSSSNRNWNYFVINLQKVYEHKDYQKKVEELDGSISITLLIYFKFQLLPDISTDFLRTLLSFEGNQSSIAEKFINDWIDEFVNQHPNFIKDFYKLKQQLINYLSKKASEKGVQLEAFINLKEVGNNHTSIKGQIPVRVYDYPGKVTVDFNIDFEVLDSKKVEGHLTLSAPTELQHKVGKDIRNILGDISSLNLHTLYFEINTSIRKTIDNQLSTLLEKKGVVPVFIDLNISLDIPSNREVISHAVECVTKNDHKVFINHTLILTLKDLGKFFSSKIDNLNDWVKKELKRLTQDYIFEKDFTELVVGFKDVEIKDGMKREVEKIGYEIKQQITVPDLQKIVPNSIELEVGGDNQEFSTKRDEVKIKMSVVITGRINNISKMAWLLNPNTTSDKVLQKINSSILNVIRQFIHTVEPEDFYMYYDIVSPKTKSIVSEDLKKRIKKILEKDFGIVNPEIICKRLETDFIKKYQKIQRVSWPIHIEGKSGEIKYDIPFYVVGVHGDGWSILKSKCDNLEGRDPKEILKEIAKTMKHYIELRLDEWQFDFIGIKAIEFKNHLMEYINDSIKAMQYEFGLSLEVSKGWKRHKTSVEQMLEEERIEELKKNKEIKTLLQDNKVEEVKDLIDQHGKFRKHLGNPDDIKKQLKELESNTLNPIDVKERMKKIEDGVPNPNILLNKSKNKNKTK